MTDQPAPLALKKLMTACGITVLAFSTAPILDVSFFDAAAYAAGKGGGGNSGGGGDNSGGDNSGGQGNGGQDSGNKGGSSGKGSDNQGSDQSDSQATNPSTDSDSSAESSARAAKKKPSTGGETVSKGASKNPVTKSAAPKASGRPSIRTTGETTLADVFKDVAGEDDESDRPDWSGQPGGKDGAGGGQPSTSGSKKGDLFGDLFVIARDDNGLPLLTPEGWVQPLDADGNPIALDDEGHPLDESLTQEVELGRLNVARAPVSVLDRRADEVITLMQTATAISTDASGRLVFTLDGTEKTIDSPLENLAIYKSLMTTGTIPGVSDLPGTDFDFLVDGKLTDADLVASASFLAAATDKTGIFTSDEIAYINTFLDVNTETIGTVTYSDIDYSDFTYSREGTYSDVTVEVLVLQDNGSWMPTEINVFESVFGSENVDAAGSLTAYTQAADDARSIVNFIHEYEVPAEDLSSVSH
jgi:hypothetical protein